MKVFRLVGSCLVFAVLSFDSVRPASAATSLYIIAEGTPTLEQRGFFNSLEIAAIPEPSSMILVLAASTGLLWWRRR